MNSNKGIAPMLAALALGMDLPPDGPRHRGSWTKPTVENIRRRVRKSKAKQAAKKARRRNRR